MAYPSTEVNLFRGEVRRLVAALRDVDVALAVIEDQGATDQARQTFFEGEFGPDSNNPDISWAEFVAGVTAVRNIRTARDANKLALAKLLP